MPTNGQLLNGNRILGPNGLPWTESDPRGGPESGFALPHIYNFSAMLGSAWKVYYRNRFDEAMRAGRSEVTAMKRDAFLMGIFKERRYKVMSQKLSIEVENDKDPWQKAIKAGLMQIIRNTPRFRKLMKALYWGVWDGRAGAQVVYEWRTMEMPSGKTMGVSAPGAMVSSGTGREMRRALCIRAHQPVNGDKITHHYDGTPIIMVNRARISELPNVRTDDVVNTEEGQGLILRGTWRNRFIIHSHEWMDADFFDVDEAEAIHGVGIRHFVYWLNTLRLEWLSNVADWCERTGLGVRLWYYQGGNAKSKAAVEEAARNQSDRTNILIPKYGDRAVEGVDYIDTASNGADLLLRLQEHLESIIERYMIGQTLSAHTEGHGLGGSGVAGMHEDTKHQIIFDDAMELDETLAEDWLKQALRWTWPEHKDMPFRLVPNFADPEADKVLTGIKTVVELGAKVRTADAMGLLGLPEAEEGDEVLQQQQVPGMGMPGEDMGEEGLLPEEEGLLDEIMGGEDSGEDGDEAEQFTKTGAMTRYVGYDPQKHPHKGEGPGGGQFTSSGSGGSEAGGAKQKLPYGIEHEDLPRVKEILAHYEDAKDRNQVTDEYRHHVAKLIAEGGHPKKAKFGAHMPVAPQETITPQPPGPSGESTANLDESHATLNEHYESFGSKSYEQIGAAVEGIGKKHSTEEVKELAKRFGLYGSYGGKNSTLDAIKRKITERKESAERIQFGDEPKPSSARSTKDIYEGIPKGETTYEHINQHVEELGGKSKAELAEIAREVLVTPTSADTKKSLLERISSSMKGRLESRLRTAGVYSNPFGSPFAEESKPIEATPSQMLKAVQESQDTGKDAGDVVKKYQRGVLENGLIEVSLPAAQVQLPAPIQVPAQPVVVNLGNQIVPTDAPRTVVVRDDNGLVSEVHKLSGDQLLSKRIVERNDKGVVTGWRTVMIEKT